MAVEFKVGVVKTEGYKGLDCGSRYVGWTEMGFVLEAEYGGREGFLHVTRGVEGFDVQRGILICLHLLKYRPHESRIFPPQREST